MTRMTDEDLKSAIIMKENLLIRLVLEEVRDEIEQNTDDPIKIIDKYIEEYSRTANTNKENKE